MAGRPLFAAPPLDAGGRWRHASAGSRLRVAPPRAHQAVPYSAVALAASVRPASAAAAWRRRKAGSSRLMISAMWA